VDLGNPPQIEARIAQCRLILSVVALAAVFADPTEPFASVWLPVPSGRFTIAPSVLLVMGTHLAYSLAVYLAAMSRRFATRRFTIATMCADVLLGAAIALLTEGATSPFYAFFSFAVVSAGFRGGFRPAMLVTMASVSLYLGMIVISTPDNMNEYIMRPAYLAIVGYLVGYLGQQRIELQHEVRQLEAAEQRHRIARDLHDGFAQALAGVNLRIEGCRRLIRRDASSEALSELTDLQASVNREYDELRAYMAALAGIRTSPAGLGTPPQTRVSLRVTVDGSLDLVDHVLQIAREGAINVRRHAAAAAARIEVSTKDSQVIISIDDDGVGLRDQAAPWSMVSRIRELGGQIDLLEGEKPGAHLLIRIPQTS
jgi:signal transduction histidine kinase